VSVPSLCFRLRWDAIASSRPANFVSSRVRWATSGRWLGCPLPGLTTPSRATAARACRRASSPQPWDSAMWWVRQKTSWQYRQVWPSTAVLALHRAAWHLLSSRVAATTSASKSSLSTLSSADVSVDDPLWELRPTDDDDGNDFWLPVFYRCTRNTQIYSSGKWYQRSLR